MPFFNRNWAEACWGRWTGPGLLASWAVASWTIWAEFRDCFRTVRVEISRLFLDSPDRNFKTVFEMMFGTELRFGFDPGTDVFGLL